ncbi:hypothetical protein BpHYR1_005587 [Brachionus plicatilis]|uniref:Uncharacterized protein n=1 Tax=Brachionus plicatilis TaxID=10195 RepID=A0A3M7RI59_BRAPC|nr:hypothetical protein BpHYR1_005587 [Brachionus plicatilis]
MENYLSDTYRRSTYSSQQKNVNQRSETFPHKEKIFSTKITWSPKISLKLCSIELYNELKDISAKYLKKTDYFFLAFFWPFLNKLPLKKKYFLSEL